MVGIHYGRGATEKSSVYIYLNADFEINLWPRVVTNNSSVWYLVIYTFNADEGANLLAVSQCRNPPKRTPSAAP